MSETLTETGDATTAAPAGPADGAAQYVDSLVDRWDDLIDWDQRRTGERGFFSELLHGCGARSVLDVAAGTGYHSVTLALSGFTVTAADGSAAMLERTRRNAARHGVELPTVHADWRGLPGRLAGGHDAVVCLGSSFPHLFDLADRRAVLREFHRLLPPGGVLVLDHRNFDAIRARRYRSSGNYYYCGDAVRVSVAHADAETCRFRYSFADGVTHHLEVYPLLRDEARELLTEAGFDTVQTFGDFSTDFDPYEADFIIHAARKA
ncbi:class I SAM-dependent methyltransferase [Streptomyces durbertensis]|uniref:Class I SAM-dependent methyltransferase n=1 Tax=Streptomyces durbertensis TaxID=2448886 RepID=A0ABR6EM39_9ACTN|nr:class I SAM-dependent methyltransferase [Streptomyces durbertensis]MBB1246308.1 class I SAM-dependent methyltransferase [Streptomyces durbertensis]